MDVLVTYYWWRPRNDIMIIPIWAVIWPSPYRRGEAETAYFSTVKINAEKNALRQCCVKVAKIARSTISQCATTSCKIADLRHIYDMPKVGTPSWKFKDLSVFYLTNEMYLTNYKLFWKVTVLDIQGFHLTVTIVLTMSQCCNCIHFSIVWLRSSVIRAMASSTLNFESINLSSSLSGNYLL